MKLINENIIKIESLCKIYNVAELYLFGSATNKSFTANSDIDLLVKFKDIELKNYFLNYLNFKKNLKQLLKREIDLVEIQALKNPILIQSINKSKKLIYG